MSYIKIYLFALKKSILTLFQYPLDTFIWMLSIILKHITGLLTIYFIIVKFNNIGGWNLKDVSMLLGFNILIEGISQMFFDAVWGIGDFLIQRGQLDIFMVRPRKLVFQLFCDNINIQCIISIMVGTGVLIWSSFQRNLVGNIFHIIIMVFFGVIINTSIYFIFNSFSFWLVSSQNVAEIVQVLKEFVGYPLTLFPKVIRIISTTVIPFGFISYYPSAYLLNKTDINIPLMVVVISLVFLLFDWVIWSYGIKTYDSIGG